MDRQHKIVTLAGILAAVATTQAEEHSRLLKMPASIVYSPDNFMAIATAAIDFMNKQYAGVIKSAKEMRKDYNSMITTTNETLTLMERSDFASFDLVEDFDRELKHLNLTGGGVK